MKFINKKTKKYKDMYKFILLNGYPIYKTPTNKEIKEAYNKMKK